jgi:hypothetical protein
VRRLLLAAVLTFGILVLTPSPSWACSCVMSTTPQHVKNAVTIASGTVDWTASDGQTRTYQVILDDVYKGVAAKTEKLSTNAQESACGVGDLAPGKRYLFFIEGQHPGAMQIGLCGGTIAYDDAIAQQVQSVTGPPGKPLPSPTPASGPDDTSARTTLFGLGAAGLLVAAAIGAFAVRRRT